MSKPKPSKKTASLQEIERKFLVVEPPADDLARSRAHAIEQGYLVVDEARNIEVRIRRRGKRCCLTIKQGDGLQRGEVEVPLSKAEFHALWPATEGQRITKSRYRLPKKGVNAKSLELDIYGGSLAGLRVAEVEFADVAAAEAFQPPCWFGREITADAVYRNATLARHGLPASVAAENNNA